ncbi:hypothetical protein [Erythrobacter sp. F6033]|uniref:hypothetical protein n=1 Tax=Erythrobacter sp. F6033 TaxID=2926401 RepID=UPI001FF2B89B|nr:hypothetical protein [Erythrobacter sp. F6033]MCK0127194.1 hypothetical protein [Erythrobacter sp. F6033]
MTARTTPFESIAGKFLISAPGLAPKELREIPLGSSWTLAVDDDVPVIDITCAGKRIGWLIGVVVDLETSSVCDEALILHDCETVETAWSAIAMRCAGSWLCIFDHDSEIELRPDADATVGVVYDPKLRQIASHSFLLVGDDYSARLNAKDRAANRVDEDGWFTGGLTAHSGIFRLLPNHGMTTSDFVPKRISLDLPTYVTNIGPVVDAIASDISATVRALDTHKSAAICLTGGKETRALLAALKTSAGAHTFVTIDYPNSLDGHLAAKLAATANLEHAIIPRVEANHQDKQTWLIGAGHAMAGANKDFFPSILSLSEKYLIGGLGGEFGRGFLWPDDLVAESHIDAGFVLARLKLPRNQANMEATTRWIEGLPDGLDAFQTLDLAYLELRMGPWAFAQPRAKSSPRSIHPLISYRQYARLLSVAPALKRKDGIIETLILRQWPELLDIPINQFGDFRDHVHRAKLALMNPGRVFRKLKQIVASSV